MNEEGKEKRATVLGEPDVTSAKKMILLGSEVGHSCSPAIFRALFRETGLPWTYEVCDVATAEKALARLEQEDWYAVNVTTPFKALALRFAGKAETAAQAAGGANLLVRTAEGVRAFNTDGIGAVAYLSGRGCLMAKNTVAICGTGSTARAIAYAAACAGAKKVALFSRDKERAIGAAQCTCGGIYAQTYEDGVEFLKQATLVINATVLGMKPGDPAPFDTALINDDAVVMDCVYGHGASVFGERALNGEGMLASQAAFAFQTMFMADKMNCPLGFVKAREVAEGAVGAEGSGAGAGADAGSGAGADAGAGAGAGDVREGDR